VGLVCSDATYILRFNRDAYLEALNDGLVDEDGVEAAFEVVHDLTENVLTACWVGDCFCVSTFPSYDSRPSVRFDSAYADLAIYSLQTPLYGSTI